MVKYYLISSQNYFRRNLDLMQGEVMSPVLFSLFINDIEINLIVKGSIPYECANISLFLLMYADDLVLFSETVIGLQQMLDCLFEYSQKWGMEVNIEKSKVMVFRNGGQISNADTLYYDGKLVETVDKFSYLGFILYYNNKFTVAGKHLADQGRYIYICLCFIFFSMVDYHLPNYKPITFDLSVCFVTSILLRFKEVHLPYFSLRDT